METRVTVVVADCGILTPLMILHDTREHSYSYDHWLSQTAQQLCNHIKNSGEYLSESSIPMADLSQFSIEHSDTCCLCQHMIDNLSPSAPYTGTYWMMSWFQDTHSWICTHCGEPCSSFQEMGAHTSMQAFPFFHFLTVEIIAAIPCPPMIRFCAWNARELFKDTTP